MISPTREGNSKLEYLSTKLSASMEKYSVVRQKCTPVVKI